MWLLFAFWIIIFSEEGCKYAPSPPHYPHLRMIIYFFLEWIRPTDKRKETDQRSLNTRKKNRKKNGLCRHIQLQKQTPGETGWRCGCLTLFSAKPSFLWMPVYIVLASLTVSEGEQFKHCFWTLKYTILLGYLTAVLRDRVRFIVTNHHYGWWCTGSRLALFVWVLQRSRDPNVSYLSRILLGFVVCQGKFY